METLATRNKGAAMTVFEPDSEPAFDDNSERVKIVGFKYPDDAPSDCAPNQSEVEYLRQQVDQFRQLIIYLLEGGHDQAWKTRAATIASMANCDGWETTQIAAQRIGKDDSVIRKEKSKLREKFLARETLREIREIYGVSADSLTAN